MDSGKKSEVCNEFSEIVPEMAGVFKSLGDLTRLQIIYLLATDTTGTLGVSDLAARLEYLPARGIAALKDAEDRGAR